jgi:hypothetical protein
VASVKMVKLMIKVLPEAINRQLIAFKMLRCGLSFEFNGFFLRVLINDVG